MGPCHVLHYKNIHCSKNPLENTDKLWLQYSRLWIKSGQVAPFTKSGQEPKHRNKACKVTVTFRII